MTSIKERITIDDKLLNGKPTIRGKRIAVAPILELSTNKNHISLLQA
jgi:uncharacterized protein (DUF433 family)